MRQARAVAVLVCMCLWRGMAASEPAGPLSLTVRLVDSAGTPLTGVEVLCVPWDVQHAPRTTPLEPHEKSVTDEGGLCRFEGLTRDAYLLWAAHGAQCAADWVDMSMPQAARGILELRTQPGKPVYGLVRSVEAELLEGVHVSYELAVPLTRTDRNGVFHIPALPPHSNLSLAKDGYAWTIIPPATRTEVVLEPGGYVEGRVVDEWYAPVPGLRVSGRVGLLNFHVVTDSEGAFRTPWLPPTPGLTLTAHGSDHGASYNGQASTDIVAGEGRVVTIETRKALLVGPLLPGRVAPVKREPEVRPIAVSGRVAHARTREPLPASVYWSPDDGQASDFDYDEGRKVHTASDGTFTLHVPAASNVRLQAVPDDPLLYPVEESVRLDLGGEPQTGLILKVAPGTVVGGVVMTADGAPVVQGQVSLMGRGRLRKQSLDGDSRFEFRNLPPGPYTVSAGEVTIATGRLPAGTVQSDLELRLPSIVRGTLLSGVVVDASGAPITGVDLYFANEAARAYVTSGTDAEGRFLARVKEPGVYHATVRQAQSQGRMTRYLEVPLIGPAQVDVPARGTVTVRLVADRLPWPSPYIAGTVQGEDGTALEVLLTLVHERSESDRIQVREGRFWQDRLPAEPFLLQAVAPGYKARVLEAGRDFQVGDRDIAIVLERGPFGDEESVWKHVTRRPATQEALAEMAFGDYVHRNEHYYRHMAERPVAQAQEVPNGTALEPDRTPRVQETVGAEDDGSADGDLPPGPPARLVIHVRDLHGKPVRNAVAGTPEALLWSMGGGLVGLSRSDPKGRIVVDDVPAGRHVYAVSARREADPHYDTVGSLVPPRLVRFDAPAGAETVREVTLPLATKGTLEARLMEWERRTVQGAMDSAQLRAAVEELSRRERTRMGRLVVAQLAETPGLTTWTGRSVAFYADLAGLLDRAAREAVPELKRVLGSRLEVPQGPATDHFRDIQTAALVDAIFALERGDGIEYWVGLAQDAAAPVAARAHACAALGRIGSPESVRAWIGLRDAARSRPGAPPAQDRYTHGERMAEAVTFTVAVIPDGPPVSAFPGTAWVAEDYETGRIPYGDRVAHLRRFGDEWLVTRIETPPMVIP